ncbi:hypothetical protein COY17_00185 [Candidatus Saccharibacteria bacterium CG_4_10_14_0_2_um_filter_52_9]|nr:MAG: hypothetical protein COY17_00185 [Candidatus Saccharibacteria bacterium CG_4_10_14_0_2_um_filter_52_9]
MSEFIEIAGVVARNEQGEYLLVQEKIPEAYGKWNLPAGHIDEIEGKPELPTQAALREGNEETGYEFELLDDEPLLVDDQTRPGYRFHTFWARVVGGELRVDHNEILDAGWFDLRAVMELDQSGEMRADWQAAAIRKAEEIYENPGN